MGRVTLQDIAEHLGLSRSTVCRGLRDHPFTSLETRRRIREACQKHGYRPDPVLSELGGSRWRGARVSRSTVIAYITYPKPGKGVGFDMSPILRKEAAAWGFELATFRREDFDSSNKLEKVIRNRGITDIIIGTAYKDSAKTEFDWRKYISIQLLPGFFSVPLHSVVRDHLNVVVTAWRKAVEHGYGRIGIVLLDHGFPLIDDFLRLSGVNMCQHHLFPHLEVLPPLLYKELETIEFRRWIEAHHPDVIIGFNDRHHVCYRAMFGRDIPYIDLHKQPDNQTLSGIDDDAAVYAKEAINLILHCRNTHQWGLPHQRIDHVVEPTWFEGSSLPMKRTQPPKSAKLTTSRMR